MFGLLLYFLIMGLGIWGIIEETIWVVGSGSVPVWIVPVDITEGVILLGVGLAVASALDAF